MKYESRFEVLSVKRPGQKGTKRLLAKYGENLRNVRYIRDKLTGDRFRTVEILLDEEPWDGKGLDPELTVGIKVGLHEKELRAQVKQLGGVWDQFDRVWLIKFKHLETLGLVKREFMVREDVEADYIVQ